VISKGRKLTDPNEGLLRRAFKKGKSSQILDQITNRSRASAAAFEPRKIDEALSVNVESPLLEARLPLTWSADPDRQYVARITVGDCIKQNLEAYHCPDLPKNPHHGHIWGLVEMRVIDEDQYERPSTLSRVRAQLYQTTPNQKQSDPGSRHEDAYCFAPIGKASPPTNRASKARLNTAAASALSITIRSLFCRLRPEAEKLAAPPVDLVALEVHRGARLVLDPYLDARRLGEVIKNLRGPRARQAESHQ